MKISGLSNRLASAEIIELASNGSEIILTDKQVPIAKLVPLSKNGTRVPGLHKGAMSTADDFDNELPDQIWSFAIISVHCSKLSKRVFVNSTQKDFEMTCIRAYLVIGQRAQALP